MQLRTKIFILIVITTLLSFIVLVNGTTIGTVRKGDCIQLPQVCENCTYNNISSILLPLNRSITASNLAMSVDDTFYNYSYCNTTNPGTYIVNGFGDLNGLKTSWVYDFEVTGTGFEFSQARSLLYVALLLLLVFFFYLTIHFLPRIPNGNDTDDYGMLLSINNLKYLRPVLLFIGWTILIGIVFTSSNIALAYLGAEMFGKLLFTIYRIMFLVTLPGVFIWFIFIFVQIFRDREMKKMIERGIDVKSP